MTEVIWPAPLRRQEVQAREDQKQALRPATETIWPALLRRQELQAWEGKKQALRPATEVIWPAPERPLRFPVLCDFVIINDIPASFSLQRSSFAEILSFSTVILRIPLAFSHFFC